MNLDKKIKNQDGQALVEFALTLWIFILVFLAIAEFGRAFNTLNVLTSAAREGVRVAAVTGPDADQVRTTANRILSSANITGATVSLSGPNTAREVTVTVQYTYVPLTGSMIPGLSNIAMNRSSTMRWEN